MDVSLMRDLGILSILVISTGTDLRKGIIPNWLILAGLVFGSLYQVIIPERMWESLLASVWMTLIVWSIRWLGKIVCDRYGMGMGDVKLAVVIGLWVGMNAFAVLYCAILLAGLTALVAYLLEGQRKLKTLPFAPFLLGGFCLEYFFVRHIAW